MKRLIIFLCACCMGSVGNGKSTGISIPNLFPHYGGVTLSPAVTNSRIIGRSFLKYTGSAFQPFDSITYAYSFGRGGTLSEEMDDNYVSFEQSYTYLFDPGTGTYRNQFHRSQSYGPTHKPISYTCRSWKLSTSTWRDSSRYLYTYDNNQTRLEATMFQIWQNGWMNHVNFQNIFDPSGRLIEMVSTVFAMEFVYDAANRLTERIERKYSFSVGGWQYSNRYKFTYDAGSKVISYTVEKYDGAAWDNLEKYDMFYTSTGSGEDLTSVIEYDWYNAQWVMKGRHLITYSVNHNKLSDEYQYWNAAANSFESATRLQWTYNNFSQPVTYYSQTWDAANGSWIYTTDDFLYRYYYENYLPTTVGTVGSNTLAIALYPQPAQQFLQVVISAEKQLQSCQLGIYDIQGKLLQQLNAENGVCAIPIDGLATGIYVLFVKNGTERYTKQFVVSR